MTGWIDGLYALASLDGAPLSPRDLVTLGLQPDVHGDGVVLGVCDRGNRRPCASARVALGHVDEPEEAAAALDLASTASLEDLIQAAIARHGDGAPSHLWGEWSFVHWEVEARRLTLMASETLRDPLLFATDGTRAAVAPDLRALRRLDWVDASFGPGLLQHMGRATVRSSIGSRTMLQGVSRVEAGTRVRVDRRGVRPGSRIPLPEPVRWRGGFDEAVEMLDALLLRIVGGHLSRHPASTVMLSGGLDSSLLAVAAAQALPLGGIVSGITSVAPPGSGLPDELEFARAVAERAGIALHAVVPGGDGDPYRPSEGTLAWLDQPVCSPRHYLYDAIYGAAATLGADAVLDGCGGEMTVTGFPDDAGWRWRLRDALRRAKPRRVVVGTTQDAFHARLSRDAAAWAQDALSTELALPGDADPIHGRDDVWGYEGGIAKGLRESTSVQRPGMRRLFPFRDRRLLTAFAGMPYGFIAEGGSPRAPARAMLLGKVPEAVRLRTRGRAFSPDYDRRLRAFAPGARRRIPDQSRAGVGDWLDLEWLDAMLLRIAAGAGVGPRATGEVQTTACAAVFLEDWLTDGRRRHLDRPRGAATLQPCTATLRSDPRNG